MQQSTFVGWDFENIWNINEGSSYLYLRWLELVTQDLISYVESLNSPNGLQTSLVSKLENAISSIENENYNAAVNKLNAFISQVEAQRGKALTEVQADMLIGYAQWIIYIITT